MDSKKEEPIAVEMARVQLATEARRLKDAEARDATERTANSAQQMYDCLYAYELAHNRVRRLLGLPEVGAWHTIIEGSYADK